MFCVPGSVDVGTACQGKTLLKSLLIRPLAQDPFMFSGSVRTNLDPFDEHTDERLWEVSEQVGGLTELTGWGHQDKRVGGTRTGWGMDVSRTGFGHANNGRCVCPPAPLELLTGSLKLTVNFYHHSLSCCRWALSPSSLSWSRSSNPR